MSNSYILRVSEDEMVAFGLLEQELPYDKAKKAQVNGNRHPIDPKIAMFFHAPPHDPWPTIEQYHRDHPEVIFVASVDAPLHIRSLNTGKWLSSLFFTYRRPMYKFVRQYQRLFPKDYSAESLRQFAHKVLHHVPGFPIRPASVWTDLIAWAEKNDAAMRVMPWTALRFSYAGGFPVDLPLESYYMFPLDEFANAFNHRLPTPYCLSCSEMMTVMRFTYGIPTAFPLHDGKICATPALNKILAEY